MAQTKPFRWKQLGLVLLAGLVYLVSNQTSLFGDQTSQITHLVENKTSGAWTEFEAQVYRLLPDDTHGSQHQRFLIDVAGHSILVAHNIDLAPRVPVQVGDALRLRGEYVWNEKGGVLHWTHHDPQNTRAGGWIEHRGKIFK